MPNILLSFEQISSANNFCALVSQAPFEAIHLYNLTRQVSEKLME
jgi:hypothetical protein